MYQNKVNRLIRFCFIISFALRGGPQALSVCDYDVRPQIWHVGLGICNLQDGLLVCNKASHENTWYRFRDTATYMQ